MALLVVLLYGFLKGWTSEKCAQFGWATGALATTTFYDYAQPMQMKKKYGVYGKAMHVLKDNLLKEKRYDKI
jgi:hypothetical protein